jgi:hypothetical protein
MGLDVSGEIAGREFSPPQDPALIPRNIYGFLAPLKCQKVMLVQFVLPIFLIVTQWVLLSKGCC